MVQSIDHCLRGANQDVIFRLFLSAFFSHHCPVNQFAGQLTRLLVMNLPANNLTTVNIQYQVEIPELTAHPGRNVTDAGYSLLKILDTI